MQIDLLATNNGEVGILANSAFSSDVSGAIFDVAERSLTLEFGAAMDSMKLNCPVGEDFVPLLIKMDHMHVCAIEKGRMTMAKQAPIVKVSMDEDDVVNGHSGGMGFGIMGLQSWLKKVMAAQPVHRDNLADTGSNGGIMFREGLSPATLQAAPHLAKALVNEKSLAQQNAPKPQNYIAPPSLGPGSVSPIPGLGNLQPRTPRNPTDNQE